LPKSNFFYIFLIIREHFCSGACNQSIANGENASNIINSMISYESPPQTPLFGSTPPLIRNEQNIITSEKGMVGVKQTQNISDIDFSPIQSVSTLSPLHESGLLNLELTLMDHSNFIPDITPMEMEVGTPGQDNGSSSHEPPSQDRERPQKRKKLDNATSSQPEKKPSTRWNAQTLKSPIKLMKCATHPLTSAADVRICMEKLLKISEFRWMHEMEVRDANIKRLSKTIRGILT
jgi:hypothetical protein